MHILGEREYLKVPTVPILIELLQGTYAFSSLIKIRKVVKFLVPGAV